MATLTQTKTFTTNETVTAANLNLVAGAATVTDIANADIAAAAAIADTKLGTISTAGKVNATALTATSQATGDIMYYNGSAWIRLAIGTVGQTLTVAVGVPTWA